MPRQTIAQKKALEAAAQAAPAETPPEDLNGVLIRRTFNETGNADVAIQLLGDVKITEVQTILKLALRAADQQIGV